jgi:hypothetical protein
VHLICTVTLIRIIDDVNGTSCRAKYFITCPSVTLVPIAADAFLFVALLLLLFLVVK